MTYCCRTLGLGSATMCCATAAALLGGCAPMMQMRPAADSYTYDVGVASGPEIQAKTLDILARFGYRVARQDGPNRVYIESDWQSRQPVDDLERNQGYEIISRVTLSGAPRSPETSPALYHVLLTVENRFVPLRGTNRENMDRTSSADYARSIVKQMSLAFASNPVSVTNEPRPF